MHIAAKFLEVPAGILGHNVTEVYGFNGSHVTTFWWSKSCDFLYVPEKLRINYIGISLMFTAQDIHAEATNSHMIGLLVDGNHSEYETMTGRWLWGRDRANTTKWGLAASGLTDNMAWVHAIKLSRNKQRVVRWWEQLTCSSDKLDSSFTW